MLAFDAHAGGIPQFKGLVGHIPGLGIIIMRPLLEVRTAPAGSGMDQDHGVKVRPDLIAVADHAVMELVKDKLAFTADPVGYHVVTHHFLGAVQFIGRNTADLFHWHSGMPFRVNGQVHIGIIQERQKRVHGLFDRVPPDLVIYIDQDAVGKAELDIINHLLTGKEPDLAAGMTGAVDQVKCRHGPFFTIGQVVIGGFFFYQLGQPGLAESAQDTHIAGIGMTIIGHHVVIVKKCGGKIIGYITLAGQHGAYHSAAGIIGAAVQSAPDIAPGGQEHKEKRYSGYDGGGLDHGMIPLFMDIPAGLDIIGLIRTFFRNPYKYCYHYYKE